MASGPAVAILGREGSAKLLEPTRPTGFTVVANVADNGRSALIALAYGASLIGSGDSYGGRDSRTYCRSCTSWT